jgi:hypothetical protein
VMNNENYITNKILSWRGGFSTRLFPS